MTTENEPVPEDDYSLVENQVAGRFELHRDGEVLSFADYFERSNGVVAIPHVETSPKHRRQGNSSRLLDRVLINLRETDRKVLPLCGVAVRHVSGDAANQDLLA